MRILVCSVASAIYLLKRSCCSRGGTGTSTCNNSLREMPTRVDIPARGTRMRWPAELLNQAARISGLIRSEHRSPTRLALSAAPATSGPAIAARKGWARRVRITSPGKIVSLSNFPVLLTVALLTVPVLITPSTISPILTRGMSTVGSPLSGFR